MKVPYAKKWQNETDNLRKIVLDCDLVEELKWGKPCFHLPEKERGDHHPARGRVRALVLQRRLAKGPAAHSPKDRRGAGGPLDQIHLSQRNFGTANDPEELHTKLSRSRSPEKRFPSRRLRSMWFPRNCERC